MVPSNVSPRQGGVYSHAAQTSGSLTHWLIAVLVGTLIFANFIFLMPATSYGQIGYGKRWYPETVELDAEAISATQISLTWRLNNQNRDYFSVRIYRADALTPDNLVHITTVTGTAVTYTDSDLKPNRQYSYQIKFAARRAAVFSVPSNVARVTTMDPNTDGGVPVSVNVPRYTTQDPGVRSAVKTLTAKPTASNKILLQWGAPRMTNITSLRIFRADPETPGEFVYLESVGANKHSWVDETVYPKSTYSYILRYNYHSHGALLSPPTNVATATTPDGEGPTKEPRIPRSNSIPKSTELQVSNVQGAPAFINPVYYNPIMNSATPLDGREERLLYLINQYRASKGLGPVRPSINMCRAADEYAKDMAKTTEASIDGFDSRGRDAARRARDAGYNVYTQFGSVNLGTRGEEPEQFFERLKTYMRAGDVMANPLWKIVGIARQYDDGGGWYWAVDFGAFWDYTIPLPGEDQDGRVDGNDLIRTRPPRESLEKGHYFSGYGDDGKPYSPQHCDQTTKVCWKDPVESYNQALEELSDPDNLVGQWHVQYTVSPSGIAHFNDVNGYDMTDYTVNLQINADKTWVMQGFKAYQNPTPVEAGTWKAVYDISANENLVTFYRAGKAAVTLRIHSIKNRLTFFAQEDKDFFKSPKFDYNKSDDPQIIFTPGFGFLLGKSDPFPANLRCSSCPR